MSHLISSGLQESRAGLWFLFHLVCNVCLSLLGHAVCMSGITWGRPVWLHQTGRTHLHEQLGSQGQISKGCRLGSPSVLMVKPVWGLPEIQRTVCSLLLGLSHPKGSAGYVCSPSKILAVPLLWSRESAGWHVPKFVVKNVINNQTLQIASACSGKDEKNPKVSKKNF